MTEMDDIVRLEVELVNTERRLRELKAQRSRLTKEAVGNGVSMYSIAKACGRSPSSVQRWME